MNSNTIKLVDVFNQDELASLMTAMAGYINTKNKQKRSTGTDVQAFNKILDALLVSNQLNAVEVEYKSGPIGVAEYKIMEGLGHA